MEATANPDSSPSSDVGQGVVVLLCTYNEAQNLPRMFEALSEVLPAADILVVDDNSPDGTSELVADLSRRDNRYHLLKRPAKLGLGTATRAGLLWSLEHDYQFVINLDADLSHDPRAAPVLLSACTAESDPRVAVAIGSRYVPGGAAVGLSRFRQLLSRALNGYATRILRLPIHDCSGSFRCYRTAALQELDFQQLTCPGYGFLEEILVALHRAGATFVEVPIVFHTRQSGQSKLSLRDALGAVQVIHRLA